MQNNATWGFSLYILYSIFFYFAERCITINAFLSTCLLSYQFALLSVYELILEKYLNKMQQLHSLVLGCVKFFNLFCVL